VSDKLVLSILEEGALADDESMQDRWANLLANALTNSEAEVHPAFSRILSELQPNEAATLEVVASAIDSDHPTISTHTCHARTGIDRTGLDNLVRLELLRYNRSQPTTWDSLDDVHATIAGVMTTDLGLALLRACQTPRPRAY
jgi:hypothetical protein